VFGSRFTKTTALHCLHYQLNLGVLNFSIEFSYFQQTMDNSISIFLQRTSFIHSTPTFSILTMKLHLLARSSALVSMLMCWETAPLGGCLFKHTVVLNLFKPIDDYFNEVRARMGVPSNCNHSNLKFFGHTSSSSVCLLSDIDKPTCYPTSCMCGYQSVQQTCLHIVLNNL
jgi:hypothetical protein